MRRPLLRRGAWLLAVLVLAAAGFWIGRARAADGSPYRDGRAALNRGDYRRAAELLARAEASGTDAPAYWRAVALERAGEPRAALAAVREHRADDPAALRSEAELLELWLCARLPGDPGCGRPRPPASGCADVPVLAARLHADPRGTLAAVRRLLAYGGCDERTRRELVLLAGAVESPAAAEVLAETARRESASRAGVQAIELLADAGAPGTEALLDSLLRTTASADVRHTAAQSLADRRAPGAERLRGVVLDPAAPQEVRMDAILVLGESAAGSAFLRDAYPGLQSQRLRGAVIRALAEAPAPENRAWLAGHAVQPGPMRDSALAALAVSRAGRADLLGLYDRADPDLRMRLLRIYADEEDGPARVRLRQIAKTEPDPELRAEARRLLREMDDS